MVWNRVPKATHVGLDILSVGVYDAIAHFNYGEKATLDIYRLLNVEPGIYTTESCLQINGIRKLRSLYKMSEKQKKRRKIIRHLKKSDKIKTYKLKVFPMNMMLVASECTMFVYVFMIWFIDC